MHANDLIRRHGGAETLAAGIWQLPSSHVSLFAQAHPRTGPPERTRAPVAHGVLAVADEADRTSLAVTIRPVGGDTVLGQLLHDLTTLAQADGGNGPLVLRVAGLAPDGCGEWRGSAHVESATQCWRASMEVDYRGVHSSGERALAWFVLRCEIVTDAARGLRRRRSIGLRVDLLAIAPELGQAAVAA